jgi:hypothetical protein
VSADARTDVVSGGRFHEDRGSSRVISIGLFNLPMNGCCVGIVASSPRDVQSYISIVRD